MTVSPNVADPTNVPYRQITYNADNMPLRIDVPVSEASGESCAVSAPPPECFETIEFVYDGDMRRAKKVTPNGSTYYIGAHYEIINGIPTKYIFAGNLRIAQITAAGLQYFHKDHLHSSTAVSDGFGETVETTEYFPFGFERSHSGIRASNYKYTDQELDLSTGLYNYDARLYDPVIAIFISADSLLPDTYDPQQLNRFSYARNNPLKYIDPDGHAPILSKSYIDPISGELINEPPQRLRTFDLKIGKSFRFRFNPLTFGLSTIAGRIPGFGLPAGITGSKTGAAVKASKSLVRSKLPDLPKILTRAFEGPVRFRTFKTGEKVYRSPWVPDEAASSPGSWFGSRRTSTQVGTDSMYQIKKWNNPNKVLRTYEFTQDVTVYYGKVKGGTGYQALFPKDINPGDVLKFIGEAPLK